MHKNSKLLFSRYAVGFFKPEYRVLELGAHIPSPYKALLEGGGLNVTDWKYADIVSDRSDPYREMLDYLMLSDYEIEAPMESFDLCISGQVLEHVKKPWVWIKEISRLLRKGGVLITISPVSWPYHEAPVDCWRAHPEGMRALYDEAGVEVELCVSECLESKRSISPGKGRDVQSTWKKIYNDVFSLFGAPVEASIDCITIGKKR